MSADEDEMVGGSEEAVRVFVRIRPLNKRELAEKQTIGWNFNETSMLQDTQNGQRVYAFDRCFSPDGLNKEVYDVVGKPVVLKALEGFNGTVFTCKCRTVVRIAVLILVLLFRWSDRKRVGNL
jgi:hypothetical protein